MTPTTFVLLSGTLTFGIPLALAIYELMNLRPSPGGGDEPPPEPRFPHVPTPLPACLLPRPVVVRDPIIVRMLEDA